MSRNNLLLALILFILNYLTKASRVFEEKGSVTILAIKGEEINVECKAHVSMTYCGFVHPNGERYSFTGNDLGAGRCVVKIKATESDAGLWTCHVGTSNIGEEINKKISVRVVGELAAIRQNITVMHAKPVTLSCATSRNMQPLRYCRFEPPNGRPFSINDDITKDNPIMGKYYYPQNKSLDRGDCAVTIRKVKYEDVGLWTCGAGLDDGKEHIDNILLEVEGLYTLSTASMTGITVGTIGGIILIAAIGYMAWKKRSLLGSVGHDSGTLEAHELGPVVVPSRSPRESPRRSPTPQRHEVPHLVVQSPSEAGSSPC